MGEPHDQHQQLDGIGYRASRNDYWRSDLTRRVGHSAKLQLYVDQKLCRLLRYLGPQPDYRACVAPRGKLFGAGPCERHKRQAQRQRPLCSYGKVSVAPRPQVLTAARSGVAVDPQGSSAKLVGLGLSKNNGFERIPEISERLDIW